MDTDIINEIIEQQRIIGEQLTALTAAMQNFQLQLSQIQKANKVCVQDIVIESSEPVNDCITHIGHLIKKHKSFIFELRNKRRSEHINYIE